MDIISAILALDPNAEVSVSGESLDGITWHDGNPNNITNDQITAKQAELKTAYDNNKYQRDRQLAYLKDVGSWEEQLDMIYHDIDNWKAEIKKVKDKYPKG
jgi:hypothetical protein